VEMYWECVPGKVRALAVQHSQAYEAPQGDGDGVWADNQDALKDQRRQAAAMRDVLDPRWPKPPTLHAVCSIVLYTKTYPTVSHDDSDNTSNKNRKSVSVALKALHLEGAF